MINNIDQYPKQYTVIPRKDVIKNDIPKIKSTGRYFKFERIVNVLKRQPTSHLFYGEKLNGKPTRYTMRLDIENQVEYTIDTKNKVVKIYSAWSHP